MLFEGRYKTQDYFRYFLYFLFHQLSFRKQNVAYCCLPAKDSLIIQDLYSKDDGFTYGQSIQYKMLLVRLHVYRSINPLPHMAILGSTNSAANRDMIRINGDTVI